MARAGERLVTLLSAWNEADADARAAILDGAASPASFTYDDGSTGRAFDGTAALGAFLEAFRGSLPDATLLPIGSPASTDRSAMVRARLDRSGETFAQLQYFAVADDDGLTHVAGFVESE